MAENWNCQWLGPERKAAAWTIALSLLKTMTAVDVVTYSATLSACEKASAWQHAALIFEEVKNFKVQTDDARQKLEGVVVVVVGSVVGSVVVVVVVGWLVVGGLWLVVGGW